MACYCPTHRSRTTTDAQCPSKAAKSSSIGCRTVPALVSCSAVHGAGSCTSAGHGGTFHGGRAAEVISRSALQQSAQHCCYLRSHNQTKLSDPWKPSCRSSRLRRSVPQTTAFGVAISVTLPSKSDGSAQVPPSCQQHAKRQADKQSTMHTAMVGDRGIQSHQRPSVTHCWQHHTHHKLHVHACPLVTKHWHCCCDLCSCLCRHQAWCSLPKAGPNSGTVPFSHAMCGSRQHMVK